MCVVRKFALWHGNAIWMIWCYISIGKSTDFMLLLSHMKIGGRLVYRKWNVVLVFLFSVGSGKTTSTQNTPPLLPKINETRLNGGRLVQMLWSRLQKNLEIGSEWIFRIFFEFIQLNFSSVKKRLKNLLVFAWASIHRMYLFALLNY